MGFEAQYYAVLEGLSKDEIPRIEEVRQCALQCFKQHWVVYQLEQWLTERYRSDELVRMEALLLAQRGLSFLVQTSPWASHTLASAYETVGDILLSCGSATLSKERWREAASHFEQGFRVMGAIGGENCDAAIALRNKWSEAQERMEKLEKSSVA
jgi:hypothetical protein